MRAESAILLGLVACGGADVRALPPTLDTGTAPTLEADASAILHEMAAVDTSYGHETDALAPVKARLDAAGVASQILESAPGRGNLVARLSGSGKKMPLMLLAHVDVVPVDGQPWTVRPFPPSEKDGFLWGRGIADDKSMAAAFTAIVLELARRGHGARSSVMLSRDIVLVLSAGEETGGFAGVQWLLKNHLPAVKAEVALNEGGALVTTSDFSEVSLVGIGVAEKSYQSFKVIARGGGGHSSIPNPNDDPALALARALVKIGEHRFPVSVLPEARSWFSAAAAWEKPPLSEALLRTAGATGALRPDDEALLTNERAYGALVRTTCVTTMLKGSPQDNVLPTSVEAIVNCRILPNETRAQTRDTLVKLIGNPAIEVTPDSDHGVGPSSPAKGEVPAAIERVARASFPKAKIVTSMSTGATDSRHLRAAGIVSYGLSGAPTSIDEVRKGHGAHGPDERRPVKWLGPAARFLRDVVVAVAQ